ncbi:hypothetical protein ES706_02165 [subsurface metagenome]
MEDESITLRLTGDPENVPALAFLEAIRSFLNILVEVDVAVSARPRGSLKWLVTELSSSIPAITLMPKSIAKDLDVSADVIRATADGLETLERETVRPAHFSDAALESAGRMVSLIGRGISRVTIFTAYRLETRVTQHVAANVDEIMRGLGKALGTVEGTIEMVTIHERRYFNLYEALTRQAIPCYFQPELFEMVKDALGKRVGVYGEIRTTRAGQVTSITAKEVTVFPPREKLPQTDDVVGILADMTRGLDIEEYIKRLHGD